MRPLILLCCLAGCREPAPLSPVSPSLGGSSVDDTGSEGGGSEGGGSEGGSSEGGGSEGGGSEGGGSEGGGSGDDTGTGELPDGPCADGGWAGLTDAEVWTAVHVDPDAGDDSQSGGPEDPLATAEAAEATGSERIFLWPGAHAGNLSLADEALVLGCGSDSGTTLSASDAYLPVVKISGPQDALVKGLELSGGTRTLQIWQEGTATVEDLVISGATRGGIVFEGTDHVDGDLEITVQDVRISAVTALDDRGYGLSAFATTLHADGLQVSDAVAGGVVIQATPEVVLSNLSVSGTVSTGTSYGRGLQLTDISSATLQTISLTDNADIGLASIGVTLLEANDLTITGTLAAQTDGDSTGHGLVIAADPDDETATSYNATVIGGTVEDNAGAGVIGNASTVSLSSVQTEDNGVLDGSDGSSIYEQSGASITSDLGTVNTPSTDFTLDLTGLATDDPS